MGCDIKNPPVLFFITVYWRREGLDRYIVITRLHTTVDKESKKVPESTRLWSLFQYTSLLGGYSIHIPYYSFFILFYKEFGFLNSANFDAESLSS